MKELKVAGAGVAILACGYLFEKASVFLYVGYTVARGGAIVAGVVVVALAIIVSRRERWAPVVLGFVIAILISTTLSDSQRRIPLKTEHEI